MHPTQSDAAFAGSIPEIYERHLVPLLFEPYADDIAKRLAARPVRQLLEIAAGTGVVTRTLDAKLPAAVEIVATDLNQAMLDQAAAVGAKRKIEWRQADAQALPFDDESFDAVVCQFGVMFFPDKVKAFSEARRVLRPGGVYVFNVWNSLAENDFARIATDTAATTFPSNPPRFLARVPYGYYDLEVIREALAAAGFTNPMRSDTVDARGRAESARHAAIGYVQGTPMRGEIEAHGPTALADATTATEKAFAGFFGNGPVDGQISAIVVTVEK